MLTPEDFEKMYKDEHGNIPNFEYIVKKDLGILDNPRAGKLMSYAWQEGHSNGYNEVYIIARNLVDLIIFDEDIKLVNVKELKNDIREHLHSFPMQVSDLHNFIDLEINKHTIKSRDGLYGTY
jgi:hypothetical protein